MLILSLDINKLEIDTRMSNSMPYKRLAADMRGRTVSSRYFQIFKIKKKREGGMNESFTCLEWPSCRSSR